MQQDKRFDMRISVELLARVDEWRLKQPIVPSRGAAIRYMIESTIKDYGNTDCDDPHTGTPLDNEPSLWLRGAWVYTQTSALRAIRAALADGSFHHGHTSAR